jgi:hypothetical protein
LFEVDEDGVSTRYNSVCWKKVTCPRLSHWTYSVFQLSDSAASVVFTLGVFKQGKVATQIRIAMSSKTDVKKNYKDSYDHIKNAPSYEINGVKNYNYNDHACPRGFSFSHWQW